MIYKFEEKLPEIEEGVFLADGSRVIGNVAIGKDSSVWHNSVIRGDINRIEIGSGSNIQELTTIHVNTRNEGTFIGSNTTVGHNVIIHGCVIGNNCLIGMGSIILDCSEISDHSLVAAGSIVTPDKKFPPRSFIIGSPARAIRSLTDEEVFSITDSARKYVDLKNKYLNNSL
ncbi:MAG TPA: gamma carbonic anhydrase family protein [Spirochaetota bacterium]|nr:gamma carbonic anhydrase family protein [Spirochaetota bacterium]